MAFALQPQPFAAGDQQLETRRPGQQFGQQAAPQASTARSCPTPAGSGSRARYACTIWRDERLSSARTPSTCAMASMTRCGAVRGARSTKTISSSSFLRRSSMTCCASQVLPTPPGPVSVTRRDVPSVRPRKISSTTWPVSTSRPVRGAMRRSLVAWRDRRHRAGRPARRRTTLTSPSATARKRSRSVDGDRQALGQPFRHLRRRPPRVRLDFLDGDERAAHLARQLRLRQVQRPPPPSQPIAKRDRRFAHVPRGSHVYRTPVWQTHTHRR